MPACLRSTLTILVIGTLALVGCVSRVTIKDDPIRQTDPQSVEVGRPDAALLLGGATLALVVTPTLKLFWNLASLQARDPSATSSLLSTDPRDLKALERLGIDSHAYQEQLVKAGVHPVILFLPHGSDPVEAARQRGLEITPWPLSAPPALLSGPKVDTLILFQSSTTANARPGKAGPVTRARIASLAGLTGFSQAENPIDPLGRQFYQIRPRDWKRSVTFEHTRCRYAGAERKAGTVLITTLTYSGGATVTMSTPLSARDWKPCPMVRGVPGVTIMQPGGNKAGRPVIIAGSYFEDPYPSPFIADWVQVK
ncbi:MAG: hypothetical protein QOF89_1271 [Acidobacteriota bacterium]|jgi:hypothetical protein|nr:hypothetical protein [Acidobacteriota bacterium]